MRIIILAGGYAKRMWPLTENQPKSLLPVGGKPMIEYILEKLRGVEHDGRIIISTNSRFGDVFHEWERSRPDGFEIVVEPTLCEDEKFGTIGAINWLLNEREIRDDVLIIAGDNLFEFPIQRLLDFQQEKKSPVVAFHDLKEPDRVRNKLGVCVLNGEQRVKEFQEKPENPKSTLAATCMYYFPKEVLSLFQKYLSDDNNPDAPGFFVKWLSEKMPVYGFVFEEDWYDIGSFEVYEEVNEKYSSPV